MAAYHTGTGKVVCYVPFGEAILFFILNKVKKGHIAVCVVCFVCALFAPFEKDGLRLMGVICLAGITVFLLLWEARGRYFLNFLPIFAMCAAIGQCRIFNAASMIKKDV